MIWAKRTKGSSKRKEGGQAVFVDNRLCNSGYIIINESDKDIEAVSMWSFQLSLGYMPRSTNADVVCDVINSVIKL